MKEEIFLELKEKILKQDNINIDLNYEDFNYFLGMIKEKIKYDEKIYSNNKDFYDLCEMSILFWGFFAFSFSNVDDYDDSYIPIVFHSLATQISNNILSILIMCNNSMDYQIGVLLRSSCELCFTLLVLLIDSNKRKKYIKAAADENEIEVWNKEFKLKDLNDALRSFEDSIIIEDKGYIKELKKWRQEIYKKYSEYVHNSFLSCFINSYTRAVNDDDIIKYNIWGEENTRTKKYLIDLAQLSFFAGLDLFQFIIKNINIKDYINNYEDNKKCWDNAGYFFMLFKERCVDIIDI